MRVLITGASGLLGLNLLSEAAVAGHDVFGVGTSVASGFDDLPGGDRIRYAQADLLGPKVLDDIVSWAEPDLTIHCAALASLEACEAHVQNAYRLNALLPRRVAEALRRGLGNGVRLVHVSTDAVFDGGKGGYCESDEPNPLSVYARTKLRGEQSVQEVLPDAIVARVNLFGWSASGSRSLAEYFVNRLQVGKAAIGFTDAWFTPLLANDLLAVFMRMVHAGLGGIYHVASGEALSKFEFGCRIARRFGWDEGLVQTGSLTTLGGAVMRSRNLALRVDKLEKALGPNLPNVNSGIDSLFQLHEMRMRQVFGNIFPSKVNRE